MPIVVDPPIKGKGSGDALLAESGTGTSLRAGVEAVFGYNGLVLNNRKVIDRYRIQKVLGLDDADVRFQEDEMGYGDGTIPRPSTYAGRTIVLNGRIEAHTLEKLRDMGEALQGAFADIRTERPLTVAAGDAERDFYVMCRKSQKLVMDDEQVDFRFFRNFMITLRASNPRKLLVNKTLDVDNTIPASAFSDRTLFIVNNPGTYTAQPTLRMNGGFTDLTLTNLANGHTFTIDGNIPGGGGFYELDVSRKAIYDQTGASKKGQLSGDYMLYEPGLNQIVASATGASGTPSILSTFSPAYI